LQSANGRFANDKDEREVQANGRRTVLLLETKLSIENLILV